MIEFAVHFTAMKDLGPDWINKTVFVAFDDIDPDVSEIQLRDWAISDAKSQMKHKGYEKFVYQEIERI